jgi:hypothetical protein
MTEPEDKLKWMHYVFLFGLVLSVGFVLGRLDARRDADALVELANQRTAIEAADKVSAQNELRAEQTDSDKMFSWYERCLDERPCTTSGPSLELRRGHEIPPMPHRALPDCCDHNCETKWRHEK